MMSKLVDVVIKISTGTFMNIKGQGHSLILDQGHSDSTFWNFFSWETVSRLKPNFIWIFHKNGETKVYSNGPGHMIKMAAMLIYGKNIKYSSSLEPKGWSPWKSICSIGFLSTTKCVQIMILGSPWPILWQGQILSLMLLYVKMVKQWIFQKLL